MESLNTWDVRPNRKLAETVASTLLVSNGIIIFEGTSSSKFSNHVVGKISDGVSFLAKA